MSNSIEAIFTVYSSGNAFVYTNAPNHPFPPKRKWVILLLVEALPQSPQNTKLCSWTQDKSCGYAILQIAEGETA